MEQLTLEQAAGEYSLDCFVNNPNVPVNEAFKAGAEWQKEKEKTLFNQAYQLLFAYSLRYPETNQLLVGHTNESIIDRLHKRLYP